jgi:hypothetical protein
MTKSRAAGFVVSGGISSIELVSPYSVTHDTLVDVTVIVIRSSNGIILFDPVGVFGEFGVTPG